MKHQTTTLSPPTKDVNQEPQIRYKHDRARDDSPLVRFVIDETQIHAEDSSCQGRWKVEGGNERQP